MDRGIGEKIKKRVLPKEKMLPVINAVINEGREFELSVTGTSMQPFLVDRRDRVFLSKCDTLKIKRGDIILYTRCDGSLILHRVYKICDDGTLTTVGDNQFCPETGVPRERVVARVTKCVRNGRTVICGKSFWDRLMKLWLIRMKAPRLFSVAVRYAGFAKKR